MKGVGDIDQIKSIYTHAKKSFIVAIKSSHYQSTSPPPPHSVLDCSYEPVDGTHTDVVCTVPFDNGLAWLLVRK